MDGEIVAEIPECSTASFHFDGTENILKKENNLLNTSCEKSESSLRVVDGLGQIVPCQDTEVSSNSEIHTRFDEVPTVPSETRCGGTDRLEGSEQFLKQNELNQKNVQGTFDDAGQKTNNKNEENAIKSENQISITSSSYQEQITEITSILKKDEKQEKKTVHFSENIVSVKFYDISDDDDSDNDTVILDDNERRDQEVPLNSYTDYIDNYAYGCPSMRFIPQFSFPPVFKIPKQQLYDDIDDDEEQIMAIMEDNDGRELPNNDQQTDVYLKETSISIHDEAKKDLPADAYLEERQTLNSIDSDGKEDSPTNVYLEEARTSIRIHDETKKDLQADAYLEGQTSITIHDEANKDLSLDVYLEEAQTLNSIDDEEKKYLPSDVYLAEKTSTGVHDQAKQNLPTNESLHEIFEDEQQNFLNVQKKGLPYEERRKSDCLDEKHSFKNIIATLSQNELNDKLDNDKKYQQCSTNGLLKHKIHYKDRNRDYMNDQQTLQEVKTFSQHECPSIDIASEENSNFTTQHFDATKRDSLVQKKEDIEIVLESDRVQKDETFTRKEETNDVDMKRASVLSSSLTTRVQGNCGSQFLRRTPRTVDSMIIDEAFQVSPDPFIDYEILHPTNAMKEEITFPKLPIIDVESYELSLLATTMRIQKTAVVTKNCQEDFQCEKYDVEYYISSPEHLNEFEETLEIDLSNDMEVKSDIFDSESVQDGQDITGNCEKEIDRDMQQISCFHVNSTMEIKPTIPHTQVFQHCNELPNGQPPHLRQKAKRKLRIGLSKSSRVKSLHPYWTKESIKRTKE